MSLKIKSALNKRIEEAVKDINKLEKKYGQALYYATRRYNDRIYAAKRKKSPKKKCQKKQK